MLGCSSNVAPSPAPFSSGLSSTPSTGAVSSILGAAKAAQLLQKLPSRSPVEPVFPKCKWDMRGVNLIPGFPVFSNCLFQCAKCGHSEAVYPEAEEGRTFSG